MPLRSSMSALVTTCPAVKICKIRSAVLVRARRREVSGGWVQHTCSLILQTLLPNPLSFTNRSKIASGVSGPLDEVLLEANALPPANLNA